MTEKIKCKTCERTIHNNPLKHQYRPKLCPYCRSPYTHGVGLHLGFKWPKLPKDWQHIFNFFPKHDPRSIFYECPNRDCKFHTDIVDEVKFEQFPDKTREEIVNGKPVTIVISYREIVTCPKCNSHMTRKRGSKK